MTVSGGADQPAVLRLSGDVDALTQSEYRRIADEILATKSTDRLIVDMSDVATIDSSGLGLLVRMVLTHVPPRAGALLKRTGLDRVFEIDAP
jgi:anti-anti-sigma factor